MVLWDVINTDPTVLAFEEFKFQLFWIMREWLEGHAKASPSDLPAEHKEAQCMYRADSRQHVYQQTELLMMF